MAAALPPANHNENQNPVNPGGDGVSGQRGDVVSFINEDHAKRVLGGCDMLRKCDELCDVTLCVDGEEFRCHRLLLASFSRYFHAMFTTAMSERSLAKVAVNGVEPRVIAQLLDYAYTSRLAITRENVQALLSAANLLEMLAVCDACSQFMEDNMDVANCVSVHLFAEQQNCVELADSAKRFILAHFQEVAVECADFLTLPAAKLTELLESDELRVTREEELFVIVMNWVAHNEQCHDLESVLEHVRLPLCSVYFLHDVVMTQARVRSSPRCMELVEEARTFHLLQDRRSDLYGPRTRLRKCSANVEVIVCVGGEDDKVVLRSVEYFNPQSLHWLTLACVPFAISKHGLVISGNM